MGWLIELDRDLFLVLNQLHASWLDGVMIFLSGKWIWIPVGGILLGLLLRRYGWKETVVILLAVGLLITITDQLSASLIKPLVGRLRPCHDPALAAWVNLPTGKCGGQYGFVSSHAANFFGVALFVGRLLWLRGAVGAMLLLAALVSYSRIYLGVHYPGAVVGGGLRGKGAAWGWLWG